VDADMTSGEVADVGGSQGGEGEGRARARRGGRSRGERITCADLPAGPLDGWLDGLRKNSLAGWVVADGWGKEFRLPGGGAPAGERKVRRVFWIRPFFFSTESALRFGA